MVGWLTELTYDHIYDNKGSRPTDPGRTVNYDRTSTLQTFLNR